MSGDRKKILIVDDDPDVALALATILEDEGYTVVSTDNGDDLERFLAEEAPDVILLDMLLSGRDGRDITRELKSLPTTQRFPIIMLSAHPSAQSQALAAGADDFLAKPFELDELLALVAAHAGNAR
jgi:DNA-binding response OmpR family regulator